MFLDASAIIAILAREGEGAALAQRLGQARRVQVSPIAIYETVLGLAHIGNISLADARSVLDRFLEEVGAEMIPITGTIGAGALRAFDRFGKGRHPAALNLADCHAYACAEELQTPLLFKGEDFPLTDIGEVGGTGNGL